MPDDRGSFTGRVRGGGNQVRNILILWPVGGEGRLAEIYGRHAPDLPVLPSAVEQTWTMHHHENIRWAWRLADIQGTRR